jgi:hypothetical protein
MRTQNLRRLAAAAFAFTSLPLAALAEGAAYEVNADRGANVFTAIFDAPLGERINATSSAVGCDLTFDEAKGTASGTCKVPLTSVMVDNNETKTEHFQQWATNKKTDAKKCELEAKFTDVKLAGALAEGQPTKFEADVPFTVCGRAREDGKPEHLTGNVILLPGGSKGLRVRAHVEDFDREQYHVGPKWTDGWAAKIQFLAPVVAPKGALDLNLFADAKKPAEASAEKAGKGEKKAADKAEKKGSKK